MIDFAKSIRPGDMLLERHESELYAHVAVSTARARGCHKPQSCWVRILPCADERVMQTIVRDGAEDLTKIGLRRR